MKVFARVICAASRQSLLEQSSLLCLLKSRAAMDQTANLLHLPRTAMKLHSVNVGNGRTVTTG
jgi:hypothetical protein